MIEADRKACASRYIVPQRRVSRRDVRSRIGQAGKFALVDRLFRSIEKEPRASALEAARRAALHPQDAAVAGHYRDHEGDIAWLTQEGYDAHLAKAKAAKANYEATGEVETVPAVDKTRADVGMPGEMVWSWYHPWADRGVWENSYAVMSDADLLAYESLSAARRLNTPWLMVHSDQCMLPDAARRHFEVAPLADKELAWEGDTPHLHFYDHPEVVDPTVAKVDAWFRRHLGDGHAAAA